MDDNKAFAAVIITFAVIFGIIILMYMRNSQERCLKALETNNPIATQVCTQR